MFSAIFKLLRAMGYLVTGRIGAAADVFRGNKHVIAATYDAAISKEQERFSTVKEAVANIMNIESQKREEFHFLKQKQEKLSKVKQGTQVAMQKRIDELKSQGKSKEEIKQDAEFLKHESAYRDASTTLVETENELNQITADLEERKIQIAQFKAELQQMQRRAQKLKEEKHASISKIQIAQQAEAINNVLSGIEEDTTDKDLNGIREAVRIAEQKAKISADLVGNDAKLAEVQYATLAGEKSSDQELDGLLDWGEGSTQLDNAKIPE